MKHEQTKNPDKIRRKKIKRYTTKQQRKVKY